MPRTKRNEVNDKRERKKAKKAKEDETKEDDDDNKENKKPVSIGQDLDVLCAIADIDDDSEETMLKRSKINLEYARMMDLGVKDATGEAYLTKMQGLLRIKAQTDKQKAKYGWGRTMLFVSDCMATLDKKNHRELAEYDKHYGTRMQVPPSLFELSQKRQPPGQTSQPTDP